MKIYNVKIGNFMLAKIIILREGVFLSVYNSKKCEIIDIFRPKSIVWHTTRAHVMYCYINTIIGGRGDGAHTGKKKPGINPGFL